MLVGGSDGRPRIGDMFTRFKLLIAAAIFSVVCEQGSAYAAQQDGDLVANKTAALSTDALINQAEQTPALNEKPKKENADYRSRFNPSN